MAKIEEILNSVYADSTKFYVSNPYPKKGETITIGLRIRQNDLIDKIFLRYKKQGIEVVEEMTCTRQENGLAYFEAQALCLDKELSYLFYLATADQIYYYSQQRVTDYVPDESKNFRIFTDYQAPSWLAETVFYQIMPDRFANGRAELTHKETDYTYQGHQPMIMDWADAPLEYDQTFTMDFYGGDLWGIVDKLDYLQELGINGIYLNPIFTSPTHHKYDALDYFEIDPSLGGEEALIALSDEMHRRGMRLILDISINHTSSSSKWFNKTGEFYDRSIGAYHNPHAPEREFYFFDENNHYRSWFGVETMPQLNYGSQKLRDIIYRNHDSVLKRYLKPPFNIDGWRFDVADVMARNEELDVYHEVWREIYAAIKETKEDAAIIAEEWSDAWYMYDAEQWDTTMNYFQAARPLREFAGGGDLFIEREPYLATIKPQPNAHALGHRILQFMDKVPSQIQYQMFNLIDSHDVARIYTVPGVTKEAYMGASLMLFGLPGATNIWYGDEKFLEGRHQTVEGARYPMNWSDALLADQQEIFDLYRFLCHLKANEAALQWGGFKMVQMEGNVVAFTRFTDEKVYLFVWSQSEQEVSMSLNLADYGMLEGHHSPLFGQYQNLKIAKEKLHISLPAYGSALVEITR